MRTLGRWLTRAGEAVSAALLAALFLTFLLQVFSRYVLAQPFGWTLELCLTLWVWLVFFGNAFTVRERDHVTFDILYLASPTRVRRVMALVSAAAVAGAMAWAFLPTLDYVDWMDMRDSALLKISMRTVFSIYAVFMLAVIARYLWRIVDVVRRGPPDDAHALVAPEGVDA